MVAPVAASRLPVGSSAKRIWGFDAEGPGERDPLLLAAGELGGIVVGAIAQADPVEQLLGPARRRARPAARAAPGRSRGR